MLEGRKLEARRWFQQARHDLRAVAWNIEGGFHDTASFLAQQSTEKAMKSLLYDLGLRRAALLTHSLLVMLTDVSKKLDKFEDLTGEARELDLHYIPSRDPNGLPGGLPCQFYDRETAQRAQEAAEKIISRVENYYMELREREILDPQAED
jgi:HEPN domain-containing protein